VANKRFTCLASIGLRSSSGVCLDAIHSALPRTASSMSRCKYRPAPPSILLAGEGYSRVHAPYRSLLFSPRLKRGAE
jgi:hypothetical protein